MVIYGIQDAATSGSLPTWLRIERHGRWRYFLRRGRDRQYFSTVDHKQCSRKS
ncbi:hypothetical protein COCC4DRAFT_32447, partial [Bipolaris maydis ATCC 48331]